MPTSVRHTLREAGPIVVAELRLESESGVNPLSTETVSEIRAHLRAMDNVEGPHVIVISAAGRCFSAGADLKEFRTITEDRFRTYMAGILAMYDEMMNVAKPIVSVVHADARGGGAALALFSDFVVSADTARFSFPEALRGLAGGGYLMPRLVGKHRAAEMVMLGRTYSARQMHDLGLVNAVCPPGELDAEVAKLLVELQGISPGSFEVAKRSLSGGLSVGMADAMARHVDAQAKAFSIARARGLV